MSLENLPHQAEKEINEHSIWLLFSVCSSILTAGCTICFAFAPYEDLQTSMAFFALSFFFVSDCTLRLILVEIFPTTLR